MSIRGEVALTLLWVSVLLTTPSRYRRFRLPERWKLINSLRFGSLNDRLTRQDRTQIATDRDVEPSTSFDDRQDRCNSRACLLTANYGSSFASRSRGLYRVFSQIVMVKALFDWDRRGERSVTIRGLLGLTWEAGDLRKIDLSGLSRKGNRHLVAGLALIFCAFAKHPRQSINPAPRSAANSQYLIQPPYIC